MAKIIGAVLITSASFAAGLYFSRKLYKRRDFLREFKIFISSLATEIRYNTEDIFMLVLRCSSAEELSAINKIRADAQSTFYKSWKECISAIPGSYSLTKDDYGALTEFGSMLGKTDVEGQLKHIELYSQIIQKQLSEAEEEIVKKSKLYRTLGLFGGLSFSIMMI